MFERKYKVIVDNMVVAENMDLETATIDVLKALEICEKLCFFGGQRAGRELWFDKPADIQDEDIKQFVDDVHFLKNFINSQNAEIERLEALSESLGEDVDVKLKYIYELEERINTAKTEAIKEFAERLNIRVIPQKRDGYTCDIVLKSSIDNLVKEMTEEHNG